MRIFIASLLFLFAPAALAQSRCLQTAGEIQPRLTSEARRDFEAKLNQARSQHDKDPTPDSFIWLGRRTAYLGRYKAAVEIYSDAINKFPKDARLYRHRGHRLITLRCFEEAIKDFQKARKLIKGKADEIEPDGLPNARNLPTSTLQSNIWYHLGLAYYLKGDFGAALKAYREAGKVSTNADMKVATTHWLYMTLRRLGREKEAQKVVGEIGDNLDIIENEDYYKLIKLYQGKLKPADLFDPSQSANTLSNATLGYGVGNWYFYSRQRSEAEKIFRQVILGNQWASFGHIAAEVELTR